jgi:hypothetical protein
MLYPGDARILPRAAPVNDATLARISHAGRQLDVGFGRFEGRVYGGVTVGGAGAL